MKREEALALLQEYGCPENVIEHCSAVSEKAVTITQKAEKDHTINVHLVEIGALLHDCGRAVSHNIDHGIKGASLLKERGINGELQRICERHVCAGIPRNVAADIGLPPRDFIPLTMEEKIVCHADNMTNHTLEELRSGWMSAFGLHGPTIVMLLETLYKELEPYTTVDNACPQE